MSDSGQFEDLATEVLRWSDEKYGAVIQTGINTEGKPINDPVDGLGQVPDANPPHYVLLEFTTTQKSGLEKKWLANPDPESGNTRGDLIKAADLANEIREDVSEADFTAVLVSNRVLGSELVRAVYGTANAFNISVDVWDVHRLSGFLQTDPDGQYIRKEHFGIDEERLSKQLLLELSGDSLSSYQESFHIPIDGVKIERPELSKILDSARNSGVGSYFIPVVGNSGFGKSVICYQALVRWRVDGKPALRLDSEDIENSKTLSQAIQSGLTRLKSSLEPTAGQKALQLARENSRLLIVVDDLNRANNPSHLLSQLQNWMGGVQDTTNGFEGGEEAGSGRLPITIVCPLWPRIWAKEKRNITQNEFAQPVEIGPLSADSAGELIQLYASEHGHDFTDEGALDLAKRVGRDPHLIGLLGQLMYAKETIDDLPDTSKEVLSEYSEYAFETASEASDGPLIVGDYQRAVEELSRNVMEARNLTPEWREVCDWSWSTSQTLDGIRNLTEQEQLFTILKQRAERILSFRHDRIRDFLLADAGIKEINRTGETPAYLNDPYYYSILGTAITYFRPSETGLSELRKKNPLSLLEAINKLSGDSSEYEQKLSVEFQRWLDDHEEYTEIPNSTLDEIMDILYQTDSKQVLEIAESLPQFPPVLLARFRNGDLEAGIQYCTDNRGGSPNVNNPQRNSVFDDAIQRGGNQYTDALSKTLSSVDAKHVQGALRLAGYFGQTELGSGIRKCWENHGDDPELLPAFLWAAFNCCIPEDSDLVDQVITRWESLPSGNSIDDESVELGTGDVFKEVKHSLKRDISEDQVEYLINAVEKVSDVEHYLVSILVEVPDSEALELVVKKRGENIRKLDGMSPWATTLLDPWSPRRSRGQALPPEPKKRMKEIWTDDENIDQMRTGAFQLWARNAEEDDIGGLKRASKDDLFEYGAHYHRLRLGDKSVITSSSLDFADNDGLLNVLSNAWGPEAYELVDELLSQYFTDESENLFYNLGGLLYDIPRDDAERILDQHWEKVKTHPKFFQAALFTGTSRTEQLAEETYRESDNPGGLLNHIGMNFGFNTNGRSQLISKRQLISIEPYMSDIPDMDLTRITEKAYELGMEDWAAEQVKPHLKDDRKKEHFPKDEDFLEELNEIKNTEEKDIRGWMIRFENRSISKSHVFGILEEWLQNDPTLDKYRMSVEVIKNWGTRENLRILEDILLDEDKVRYLNKDAEFGVKVRSLN